MPRLTRVEYEPAPGGLLTRVIAPTGHTVEAVEDPFGRPVSTHDLTRESQESWTRQMDGGELVEVRTDALGTDHTTRFDALGRLVSYSAAATPWDDFTISYDANERTLTPAQGVPELLETDALGRPRYLTRGTLERSWSFNAFGEATEVEDGDELATTRSYDPSGRLIVTSPPHTGATEYTWRDGSSQVERIDLPGGLARAQRWSAHRPTERTLYDGDGRLFAKTQWDYDDAGRLSRSFSPRIPAEDEQPPSCPAEGLSCTTYADALLAHFESPTRGISYERNLAGQITGVRAEREMHMELDPAGRLTGLGFSDGPQSRARYDLLDRPTHRADERGLGQVWTYDGPDPSPRLIRFGAVAFPSEEDPDPAPGLASGLRQLEFGFDPRRRPISITETHADRSVTVERSFDELDRVTHYTRDGELISERTWSPEGRARTLTIHPGGRIHAELRYTDGLPTTLLIDGVERGTWSWTDFGAPERATLDELTACWTYHPDPRLDTLAWHRGDIDCANPPEAPFHYRRGPADGRGNPSFVEQRAGDRRRHDELLYDGGDRLRAWRELERHEAWFIDYCVFRPR